MSLLLRYATHSEIGLVRKNNQDSGYAGPHLLVVADGMGGAAAGDLASAVAVDTIRRIDSAGDTGPAEGQAMLEVLSGAIRRANDRIADLVEEDLSLDGMGTTVTGALFDGSQLGLAHIGDSRAYLLRDGFLERLTHDHSWVQSLVDDGKISPEEAAVHPHRSLLLKVINGQPSNDPDLTLVDVRAGDRLLFCSDGLCGLVDDTEIAVGLGMPDLEDALRHLVDEARAEGGIDNITVILADVLENVPAGDPTTIGAAAERDIPPDLTDVDTDEATEDTVVVGAVPAAGASGSTSGSGAPDSPTSVTDATGASSTTRATDDGVEDDEARYNPQHPNQRRVRRTLAGILVAVLVLGAALGAGYAWSRTQYFVGVANENVAIYQGVPGSLPGVALNHVYEEQKIPLTSLPGFYQNMVRSTIQVESLDAARQTVATLATAAKDCASVKPSTGSTPKASTTPRASTTPKTTTPPKSTPSPSTSPTPSPGPTTGATSGLPSGAPAPGEGC